MAALVLMVLAGVAGNDAGDKLTSGAYLDPSAESQRAAALLTQEFPGGPAKLVLIAETSTDTVDSEAAVKSGRELTAQLAETPGVGGVHSYWAAPDSSLRAADGRSALIALQLIGGEHAAQETAARIIDDLEEESGTLRMNATGPAAVGLAVDEQAESDLVSAEMVTLPITLLVLLLVFGSAIAAGLPLLVGAGAVVGTLAVLGLLAEATTMSTYTLNLTTALGFGCRWTTACSWSPGSARNAAPAAPSTPLWSSPENRGPHGDVLRAHGAALALGAAPVRDALPPLRPAVPSASPCSAASWPRATPAEAAAAARESIAAGTRLGEPAVASSAMPPTCTACPWC